MKDILADEVKDVRISKRLKSHPVCLTADGEISIEMEKTLNAMPNSQNIKADKVLEINVNHEVFQSLKAAFEQDEKEKKPVVFKFPSEQTDQNEKNRLYVICNHEPVNSFSNICRTTRVDQRNDHDSIINEICDDA